MFSFQILFVHFYFKNYDFVHIWYKYMSIFYFNHVHKIINEFELVEENWGFVEKIDVWPIECNWSYEPLFLM